MKRAAWRVGAFALAGVTLLMLALVVAGGRWFAASEQALMRFDSSVYGLQTGAPVVFRGVRVGQVGAIGFAPAGGGGLAVPVAVTFDRALLRQLLVAAGGPPVDPALPALIGRGLVARLAMQSLLTGQLYVDLDLDPARAARPLAVGDDGPPAIPTAPTRLQTLQTQLEGLDLAQIGRDLAAAAAATRQLLGGPEAARALSRTADAAQSLQRTAQRIEAAVGPLARSVHGTLKASNDTLAQLGQGAQQVAAAASQVQGLAGAGTPMLGEVQRTAAELSRAAATLREAAADDSVLRQNAERALLDVARAARALRELTELVDRQPDALVRGRAATP